MKLLLENWQRYINESDEDSGRPQWQKEQPELYGNCGQFALSLLLEGIKRNKKGMEIVLVHDSADIDNVEEANLYHIALYYKGKYYDARGEVTREQIAEFAPLGLTATSTKPIEGRDYLIKTYVIDTINDWNLIEPFISYNTDWTSSCKEYKDRAKKFWDNLDSL